MMNILNGGSHADNNVDFQEFMVMPVGASRFSDSLRMGVEVFHHLKRVLSKRGYSTAVGDEGGFAPNLKSNEEAIEVILEAAAQAGFSPGEDLLIALDPASSEFYEEGRYCFRKSDGSEKSAEEMVEFWENWVRQFPIASIEDGLAEDDWEGWALLTNRWEPRCNWSGTTFSSPTPGAWSKASGAGSPTPSWSRSTRSGP